MDYETTVNLIGLIRDRPCLFDPDDEQYFNHVYKKRQWDEIANEIGFTGK